MRWLPDALLAIADRDPRPWRAGRPRSEARRSGAEQHVKNAQPWQARGTEPLAPALAQQSGLAHAAPPASHVEQARERGSASRDVLLDGGLGELTDYRLQLTAYSWLLVSARQMSLEPCAPAATLAVTGRNNRLHARSVNEVDAW